MVFDPVETGRTPCLINLPSSTHQRRRMRPCRKRLVWRVRQCLSPRPTSTRIHCNGNSRHAGNTAGSQGRRLRRTSHSRGTSFEQTTWDERLALQEPHPTPNADKVRLVQVISSVCWAGDDKGLGLELIADARTCVYHCRCQEGLRNRSAREKATRQVLGPDDSLASMGVTTVVAEA